VSYLKHHHIMKATAVNPAKPGLVKSTSVPIRRWLRRLLFLNSIRAFLRLDKWDSGVWMQGRTRLNRVKSQQCPHLACLCPPLLATPFQCLGRHVLQPVPLRPVRPLKVLHRPRTPRPHHPIHALARVPHP
jgi:hypothetical protein